MGGGERLNLIANHTEYLKIWNITCERTWNITFATTVNFSKNAAHSHILMNGFNKVWNTSCFSVLLWFITDWQWQLDNFANKQPFLQTFQVMHKHWELQHLGITSLKASRFKYLKEWMLYRFFAYDSRLTF